MSSTVFIAVECCQCSTMQVKQRKQSSKSNKWTCAVCNEKQSVRQVFAQGPMAKDLRLFVQSSNMSRQQPQQQQQQPQQQHALVSSDSPRKKRRSDWTAYLDPEDDQGTHMKQEDEEGNWRGLEGEIVTEVPAELFKKPKLNKFASGSDPRIGGVHEFHDYETDFSQRNFDKHVVCPEDAEKTNCELTLTKDTSKWRHFTMPEEEEPRTCLATKATLAGASKWNDYITKDEDDDYDLRLTSTSRRKYADNADQRGNEIYKTVKNYETVSANDERVEDDIHPDFLQGSVVSNLAS